VKRSLVALPDEAGASLAQFLAARLAIPLSQAQEAVVQGGVHVAGRRERDPARRMRAGERVVAYLMVAPTPPAPRIVYRDPDVAVIDKPAGLAVSATRQSAAAADSALLAGGLGFVRVLQRLDLAASGLLVVACRADAVGPLAEQVRGHRMRRVYQALLAGRLRGQAGRFSSPVAGRLAATGFRVLARRSATTLCELTLETGRTHQIRVHAASAGHPLCGDDRHGGPPAARLLLHAVALTFEHPQSGAQMAFSSPLPSDFINAMNHF
jgi:23S rRNA pseudouridine1911/1915/1917 synthase